jgi:hypothetical protein
MRSPRHALLAALLLVAQGCGSSHPGDRAGEINSKLTISPATAMVATGQTIQFTASSPWGGAVDWSVLPATCGAFGADALFTAGSSAGSCTIVAFLKSDIRYTATAVVTVVPALPAGFWVALVQASGGRQASADGLVQAFSVVGEPTRASVAVDASGTLQVRHGFAPVGSISTP